MTNTANNSDQSLATQPQIDALRKRAQRNDIYGADLSQSETLARFDAEVKAGLTKGAASHMLSNAWGKPYDPATIPMTDAKYKTLSYYAETKAIFGLHVTPEETKARLDDMKANATEADAEALYRTCWRAAPYPTAQTPLRLDAIEGIEDLSISEGFYAVFDEDNVLRHYRIYSPNTGELRGVPVIRRYAGDMMMAIYPAEALKVLRDIDANPDEAAYRYADTFTRCWVCGKNLTDSISRLLSVGPTCRGFTSHSGLKVAGAANDADPQRRHTYRAVRSWMQANGLVDPKSRDERRNRVSASVTASQVASAWCSVEGVLDMDSEAAVALVADAYSGEEVNEETRAALMGTRPDIAAILINSGMLSAGMMSAFNDHKSAKVRDVVAAKFLDLLSGAMN